MSTTVTQALVKALTWEEVTLPWSSDDLLMKRSWEFFGHLSIDLKSTEGLTFVDSYVDEIAYIIRVMEQISVNSQIKKSLGKESVETLSLRDNPRPGFDVLKSIAEVIDLDEAPKIVNEFSKFLHDVLSIASQTQKKSHLLKVDAIDVLDTPKKSTHKPFAESVTFHETTGRMMWYFRMVNDGFSVTDAIEKALSKPLEEAIELGEDFIRGAYQVASDLVVSSDSLNPEDFAEYLRVQSPVGFEDFRRFVEGEYTYKDALFKIALKSRGPERVLVDGLTLTADLPDVRERGSATVPDIPTGLEINFNKKFHATPEISITLREVQGLTLPKILSSSRDGFVIALRNSSDQPVTGRISWFAEGY